MTRPHIKHPPIAAACRVRPGEWIRVGTYGGRTSAMVTANHIRTGRLVSYLPVRAYDAEVRGDERPEPEVWVRWVGAGSEVQR